MMPGKFYEEMPGLQDHKRQSPSLADVNWLWSPISVFCSDQLASPFHHGSRQEGWHSHSVHSLIWWQWETYIIVIGNVPMLRQPDHFVIPYSIIPHSVIPVSSFLLYQFPQNGPQKWWKRFQRVQVKLNPLRQLPLRAVKTETENH